MSDSELRDYVLVVDSNQHEAQQIATTVAHKLENRETTLIELVQSLGEYINDGDDKVRGRAISYLTAVISALPPKYLSRQQIQVLCQFLSDRIQDGGAIEGLSRLQNLARFTNEMAQTVVRAIYENFADLQSKPQAARHRILQLFNEIMDHHRKAVREMGDESLIGTVDFVGGEKDPRNLMLIFSMLRVIMVEWEITQHTEVLFDSVYAYFPITFRPPPNDPYGITSQDLKDRLRDCISSTGALAPHAFPNLLDKLDSTSATVKKDVLQAMASCARNYGASTIKDYSITLWDAVKFEVLQAQEPELADEALLVLKEVSTSLSNDGQGSSPGSPLLHFFRPVNKECLEHLQEPASRQAKASGDILRAVASGSTQSFEIVIKTIGPALLTIYQSSGTILDQRAILAMINQLFEAAIEVYGSYDNPSKESSQGLENLLHEFKERLTAMYSQALMSTPKEEVSFRLVAVNGLLLMSRMRSFLQDDEIGLFVQHLNDIVLNEDSYGRDELRKRAVTGLAEISKFRPRLISEITFPAFLARLPDSEDQARTTDYRQVLEGLAEISVEKELLDTLMRRLLNKLDLLLNTDQIGPFPYTCAIFGTINYVLDQTVKVKKIALDIYYDRIVVNLSRRATEVESGALTNESVLDLVGRTANLVIRNVSAEKLDEAAKNVYILFRNLEPADVDDGLSTLLHPPTVILISTWLLAALPRKTRSTILQTGNISETIQNLIRFSAKSKNAAIERACFRQMALLINKHLPDADLGFTDRIISDMITRLSKSNSSKTEDDHDFNLRLCFNLTRALILRLAPKTNNYLEDLVNLLNPSAYSPETSRLAAKGFATILASDDVFSKTNFAQIRLLTPQRVFQVLAPLVSLKFKESKSSTEKENYLIALSGVLGTVSSDIVMPQLPTLLPLLLQSLDISDQSVKIATLETFAVVISNNPSALEESGHIPALVKRLLSTASTGKSKSRPTLPRTRRLATRCLTLMPKSVTGSGSRANPLLALKRDVLQGLSAVLDDPKRDVRKEAVDARAAWIRSVDDPVDEDDEI